MPAKKSPALPSGVADLVRADYQAARPKPVIVDDPDSERAVDYLLINLGTQLRRAAKAAGRACKTHAALLDVPDWGVSENATNAFQQELTERGHMALNQKVAERVLRFSSHHRLVAALIEVGLTPSLRRERERDMVDNLVTEWNLGFDTSSFAPVSED